MLAKPASCVHLQPWIFNLLHFSILCLLLPFDRTSAATPSPEPRFWPWPCCCACSPRRIRLSASTTTHGVVSTPRKRRRAHLRQHTLLSYTRTGRYGQESIRGLSCRRGDRSALVTLVPSPQACEPSKLSAIAFYSSYGSVP
ncbi:hypothetical protein B0J12DRAFT_425 [Macrophomina phaseolina]|uniref:Secreted protein n=1 Tax=Macrophomina phaseolina TaxID=35725 RepID=A0ABQ8GTE6_9PEZI|nr:hypothetical protein B0J12DRAFT_425 [Macrophomina phaseolina]